MKEGLVAEDFPSETWRKGQAKWNTITEKGIRECMKATEIKVAQLLNSIKKTHKVSDSQQRQNKKLGAGSKKRGRREAGKGTV